MYNFWVYIKWAAAFLDLKLWPWNVLEMKDRIISIKSVSQFCEKIIYFQITRDFDDIFKQGWESLTLKFIQNSTKLREKSFSHKTETYFCWKLAYLSFLVDFLVRNWNPGRLELILCKLINYSRIENNSWNTKSDYQTDRKWKAN